MRPYETPTVEYDRFKMGRHGVDATYRNFYMWRGSVVVFREAVPVPRFIEALESMIKEHLLRLAQ